MTTKSITLEIWQPNDMRIQVNQGEVNSRFLEIKILDLTWRIKPSFFMPQNPTEI